MSWKEKLSSRKFLMAVGTLGSVVALEFFEVDVSPEAFAAAAAVIATWIFSEAQVDKASVNHQISNAQHIIGVLQQRIEQQATELTKPTGRPNPNGQPR